MKSTSFFKPRYISKAGFIFSLLLFITLVPVYGSGEKIALLISSRQQDKETLSMASRLENDLKTILKEKGKYDTRRINSRDEFKKERGEYLIDLSLIRFNPGTKPAGFIASFGALPPSLDIHYDLISPLNEKLLSIDDSCDTSNELWQIARRLNESILVMIGPVLEQLIYEEKSSMEVSENSNGNLYLEELDELKNPQTVPGEKQPSDDQGDANWVEEIRKVEESDTEGLTTDKEDLKNRLEVLNKM